MADFLPAYKKLRKLEGNYSNSANDLGKETYAGISRKYHPDSAIWQYVDAEKPLRWNQKLKNPEAENVIYDFYYYNYWQPELFSEIKKQKAATMIFCQYVNSGYHAIEVAQRALGERIDGIFGPKTLAAINNSTDVINRLVAGYVEYYKVIVRGRPSQRVNLPGWIDRVKRLS